MEEWCRMMKDERGQKMLLPLVGRQKLVAVEFSFEETSVMGISVVSVLSCELWCYAVAVLSGNGFNLYQYQFDIMAGDGQGMSHPYLRKVLLTLGWQL